ncbi:ATP-dependent DNA helicase RecQ [hydrothermal vent metagenome]|uniref:DNA 3'-5' helicase n=1 Tax=hydrothermal vent metagenome TaxID=652676 RepID=A0A3B0VLA1_9ZZZZ
MCIGSTKKPKLPHMLNFMQAITFFDTEVSAKNKILDIGAVKNSGEVLHTPAKVKFLAFIESTKYICGHNVLQHDLQYLKINLKKTKLKVIDTLYLSPLLFPNKPYHRLLKDDKILIDELNNPVNDAKKAKDVFYDALFAFNKLPESLQHIYYLLLYAQAEFSGFFSYINFASLDCIGSLVHSHFGKHCCNNAAIDEFIINNPIELAYCLALLTCENKTSITPSWVAMTFPEISRVMYLLRNNPCGDCEYCNTALDAKTGLQEFFGFAGFRKFAGIALQENAVKAAIANKSLLAIFPTGGGKSLTFQIPALMAGRNITGLTVIISPLQSLMKDQVDNLEKHNITQAVTINGMLDPIERSVAIQRVADGTATILYISPELLRSKTIWRLLLGRNITRFVIDEAHCFSSWGQDFRVDYLYIGDFIANLQQRKKLSQPIPVSCFTATARVKVVADIVDYFKQKLGLQLELFKANTGRTNLQYQVYACADEVQKYTQLRNLIDANNCPTIVYVARTQKAYKLASKLQQDGIDAKPYHGKMEVKEKTANQNAFIAGKIQVMVATSAFGMGVDKKDIGMVVHYDISDSLENYVQEAGRAGRDENVSANCYVLFNQDDLNKHFILLNQTKLSVKEIQQIWRAIKQITKYRMTVSNSALEIARIAGWDDNVVEIETRVITAIAALEQAQYLKRGQNNPRIFANSILCKNAMQAIDKINAASRFNKSQKVKAIRIIKKLFSSKSKKHASDEKAESRVDYISDHLGIVKEEVIKIITLLRDEQILADTKDLTAFIKQNDKVNHSLTIVKTYARLENFLLPVLQEHEKLFNLKELNEQACEHKCDNITPYKIKTILNFWAIKNWIKYKTQNYSSNYVAIIYTQVKQTLTEKLQKRHVLAEFIVQHLFAKTSQQKNVDEILVEFSVHELKQCYQQHESLFKLEITIADIEDALFYLSRIEAIKIEGGFLVIYNKLSIDRLEQNNKVQYKKDDYQQLDEFYQSKMAQIHIVGEYASKMLADYQEALNFVDDYFQLNYNVFLNKYFPGSRQYDLMRNITPNKFKQLFGELSPRQLKIINDSKHQNIIVAAGPGSGKTRVLVHKLASLLLLEDVKHEQLLMLTFSRAATTEFSKRLRCLIGNAAHFIDIKTFHSYCFDLLGKVGSLDKSAKILQETVKKIKNGSIEPNRITKTVLVIDEAQDMDEHEFTLIKTLMQKNLGMRIIAVGDDDQNIYTFRGANSYYFQQFAQSKSAKKYELLENYRSKNNLVQFTNKFASRISQRFKNHDIVAVQDDNGSIRIINYQHADLLVALVTNIIASELSGTTAILCKTNNEALQITGLLQQYNYPAKLIQNNDSFNLYDLVEIREFISDLELAADDVIISQDRWNHAKRQIYRKYKTSNNYQLCKQLLTDFQQTNTKSKYYSDLIAFIQESRLEDFSPIDNETIVVSTIHKAKGKEFDNVFILLDNFNINTDDNKRQLYVAMTRAKQNLSIHYNGAYLNGLQVDGCEYQTNQVQYASASQLTYHLTHKDIVLGYLDYIQSRINQLVSGESLLVQQNSLVNTNNETIVKFSKSFQTQIATLAKQGFKLSSAKINFIVYWRKKDERGELIKEIKIILPEICIKK